jgi:hypothetical protein
MFDLENEDGNRYSAFRQFGMALIDFTVPFSLQSVVEPPQEV